MKRLHCQPQTQVTALTCGGRLPENYAVEGKTIKAGFSNVQIFDLPEYIFIYYTFESNK